MAELKLPGGRYVGEVRDGKPHGQGTMAIEGGGKYVGEFRDGEWHGQGSYTWPNGDKYVGEFKGGYPDGQGTLSELGGETYVGEFKKGQRNGKGTLTKPNGETFVGEFKDGEPQGVGEHVLKLTSPPRLRTELDWIKEKVASLTDEGLLSPQKVVDLLNDAVGVKVTCLCDETFGPYVGDPEDGHDDLWERCDRIGNAHLSLTRAISVWRHSCGYIFLGDRAPNEKGFAVFTVQRSERVLGCGTWDLQEIYSNSK